MRDKSIRAAHELEDATRVGGRDLSHRVEGALARMLSSERPVSDEVLVERVRARLGHVCSHPHAVEVNAKGDGCIELKGLVLKEEKSHVLSDIAHVPGVRQIDDELEPHARGEKDSLQCEHARPRRSNAARMWNPSTRLVLGASAATIGALSLLRGHPFGFLLGGAGALGIARSMARRNLPRRRRLEAPREQGGETTRGLREAYAPESEWSRSPQAP